ncbi:Biotin carboxylase [Desulfuromusa kysingii]|uniref:Biotin carboxylase n=1 Tax=Desulfuromusa kysingii TaxID=37625 RepID=A0A1H3VMM4_9BACT|nr:ATP-grasp domain-containing protein [Desulfuromusa kysingii]SDZ75951.1 Biotin carboxylase [Desulfuromusa kysingii]
MNNYFLIVGAGFGQVPAIESCRALGLKTIVVDQAPSAPGMSLADIALPVDIIDIDRVVAIAKKYKVSGVMTMQSDIGVPTVGSVVDALSLPGCGRAVADRCSNKILTRKAFSVRGVPQPKYRSVANEIEAVEAVNAIGLPCIIKAPDNSGSRGVVRVDTKTKVSEAYLEAMKHTRGKDVLVEEFIEGLEIGAQAFSVGGRCVKVLLHDDELSAPPYMIPVGHAFPSTLQGKALIKAEKAVRECVEALGIEDGPSNIDLIIDLYGEPRIIEVGARIGATCLPELVFYHTGIDWTRTAIQAACGLKSDLESRWFQACAAYILQAPKDGIFHSYSILTELSDHKDLLEWEVSVSQGDRVSCLRKGTDRIGKVVTRATTTEGAKKLAQNFRNSLQWDIQEA